jgi:ATP-dependent Clp protease, protease subunit
LNTIIFEETDFGDMPVDVYQKLAGSRILFMTGEINESLASDITATLFLKDQEDPTKKITIFINSYGGSIRDALMIYDMIQMIDAPVETVCIGESRGEAVVILVAGAPGLRYATKNAIIAVGQLEANGHANVDMSDAKKLLDLFTEDNLRMMKIIAQAAGKPVKQVMEDFDRMVYMNAIKAAKYGIIDKVINFNK